MTTTALGAGAETAQKFNFISETHEKFYYDKLFREQSVSGQRKKQITFLLHLPIPLGCTPIFTN